jgi:hypothetical protein
LVAVELACSLKIEKVLFLLEYAFDIIFQLLLRGEERNFQPVKTSMGLDE